MKNRIHLPPLLREKSFTAPLLLLVVMITSFIGVFFFIRQILQTRRDIQALDGKIATLVGKRDVLSGLDRNQTQAEVNLASRALPGSSQLLAVVARIRDAGLEAGINVAQIRVAGASADKQGETLGVDIQLDIEGPVGTINAFVREVEKSLPVVVVQTGRLTAPSALAQANLTLRTFWSKIPDQLADVQTPIEQLTPGEQKLIVELEQYLERKTSAAPSFGTATGSRANPFSF